MIKNNNVRMFSQGFTFSRMAVVTESWVADSLLFVATVLLIAHWYLSGVFKYFKARGIPYLQPLPFIGTRQVLTHSQHDLARFLYSNFPGERFYGYFQFNKPNVVVKDPELIHLIMIKDFGHFHDRGFPIGEDDEIVSKNLFHLKGSTWRILRQKLISTFSTGKLKLMFDQFLKCGDSILEEVDTVAVSGEPVEARMLSLNYTTEVIGSTAFGLDISRNNPQREEFIYNIKRMFPTTIFALIKFIIATVEPRIFSILKISPFINKDAEKYFINIVKATKEYRIKNGTKRNDYFQLLLSLQQAEENGKLVTLTTASENSEEDALINQMEYAPQQSNDENLPSKLFTDKMVTAQAFVFLSAGSDTVSSSLSFMFYHIGKDAEVQRRVTSEIDECLAKHGGWSFQTVKDMVFLDQVMQETLRLYPPISSHQRLVTRPYAIPGSNSVLEKGTIVQIPIAAIHRDPNIYPNPDEFNPDRWDPDNNHKPSPTYAPFGDGPRICIAMRFAILEMKVGLAKILSQFNVHVNSKTKEPFQLDQKSFIPRPKSGIWINFSKRPDKSI